MSTKPVIYILTTDKHIDAHLLTCFVSLIVIRMIQYKMGNNRLTAERIKKTLSLCTYSKFNDIIIHLDSVSGYYEYKKSDQGTKEYLTTSINTEEDIARLDFIKLTEAYDVNLDYSFIKINEFNPILKQIKYKLKKRGLNKKTSFLCHTTVKLRYNNKGILFI